MNVTLSAIAVLLMLANAPAPEQPAPIVPTETNPHIPDLATLTPDDPGAYLTAAEDLIVAGELSPDDAALVRELLTRAVLLAHREGDPQTAASACLALADPTHPELGIMHDQRVWITTLARTLVPELVRPEWLGPTDPTRPEGVPVETPAALTLARLRNGDPRRANLVLDEPNVLDALRASPEFAQIRGALSVEQFFVEYADGWPCPRCHGDRFESHRNGAVTTHTLCSHCDGDPGPRFATADLILLLRAELALTGGGAGTWSGALVAPANAPLREPDAEHITHVLGATISGFLWRDGHWADGAGGG